MCFNLSRFIHKGPQNTEWRAATCCEMAAERTVRICLLWLDTKLPVKIQARMTAVNIKYEKEKSLAPSVPF